MLRTFLDGRQRAIYRAQCMCNTQFCTLTSLYADQVTSCFLSAVNTNPSPAPLMLSGFYYHHHLPGNHDAPDLLFASHSGKTLTGQEFYVSCLKDRHPENFEVLLSTLLLSWRFNPSEWVQASAAVYTRSSPVWDYPHRRVVVRCRHSETAYRSHL